MLKWDHIRTMLEMPRIKREWIRLYGQTPTDTDADKLYASYEPALLHILTRYADPKPYVVETIEKLRALGIKIGSTTGYTDIMMEIVAPTSFPKPVMHRTAGSARTPAIRKKEDLIRI